MMYIFLPVLRPSLSTYPFAVTAIEREARAFFGRLPLVASCHFGRFPLDRMAQRSSAHGGGQS